MTLRLHLVYRQTIFVGYRPGPGTHSRRPSGSGADRKSDSLWSLLPVRHQASRLPAVRLSCKGG